MSAYQFESAYQGISRAERWHREISYLQALAFEVHRRTELFDRSICRVMNERRIAVPQTAEERRACEKNYRTVINELLPQAEAFGLDKASFISAIRREARLFEEKFARGEIDLKKPMI